MTKGHLRKMHTELDGDKATYALVLNDNIRIPLNEHINKSIALRHTGEIHCRQCGRKIKKSYNEGYCFPCVRSLAACDICIVRPELCHFDKGTCRDPQWAQGHCMQEHIVYLANSSGIKVGLTRHSQIPTRWIDQGAGAALPIYKASNRYQAGLLEVAIKAFANDKTNWRRMLKGPIQEMDLVAERDRIWSLMQENEKQLLDTHGTQSFKHLTDNRVQFINYPVARYPEKVTSLNMDKTPTIAGILTGIKGQYLIFDSGVINVRKYTSYEIEFDA